MPKYNDGLPTEEIELSEFREKLEASKLDKIYKAYLVLLFWIGCRRSEPLHVWQLRVRWYNDFRFEFMVEQKGILKEDISEHDGSLWIKIAAFKGGLRGGEVELPLDFYGVDLVKLRWIQTRPTKNLFWMCDKTAYRAFKLVFPNKTPHHARFNRITQLRKLIDGDTVSLDNVKAWTGIRTDKTMEHYGLKNQAGIHRVALALSRVPHS